MRNLESRDAEFGRRSFKSFILHFRQILRPSGAKLKRDRENALQ